MRQVLIALVLVALATGSACRETTYLLPPTPTSPTQTPATPTTPTTTTSTTHTFDFRVNGNATAARIVYASPADGALQAVSALPFDNAILSTATSVFLSLEATPISFPTNVLYPFMSVQIVVDGISFREATLNTFGGYPLSVSGTWRAPGATVLQRRGQ